MAERRNIKKQFRIISCAECRKQKLRCDRVFPCISCRKRGCAAICPEGVAPPRKKVQDQSKNTLTRRIRELEDALASLQSANSDAHHPLLSRPLRDIAQTHKDAPNNLDGTTEPSLTEGESDHQDDPAVESLSENLGTLSLAGYGKSHFYGTSGSALKLWGKGGFKTNGFDTEALGLPPELMNISLAFLPTSNYFAPCISNWIEAHLPPYLESWNLCESFFENGGYIFVPLWRSMFMDEIFSFFYGENKENNVEIPPGHRLALLLMVFALGDMLDPTKPAMPTGGKKFYYLARTALCTTPVYSHPTLTAVQALLLMALYVSLSDHEDADETVYILSSITVKLSYSLGLHREMRRFTSAVETSTDGNPPSIPHSREQELRRVIFHEVMHFESWMALRCGRPSMINPEHMDCEPPGTYAERKTVLESRHLEGQAWSYNFLRECLIPVLEYCLAIKQPKYSDVLKLDKIIRSNTLPTYLVCEEDGPNGIFNRAAVLQHFSGWSMREILLLYLHRPYFASALTDFSEDPLESPFRPSVLTSFGASCAIISKITALFEKERLISIRLWIFWDQLFVPCLILGTLIIRSPGCSLARTALAELDKVVDLLDRAQQGLRPSILLPHATKLKNKAHTAYATYYASSGMSEPTLAQFDITNELIALRGKSTSSRSTSTHVSPAPQTSAESPQAIQPDNDPRSSSQSSYDLSVGAVPVSTSHLPAEPTAGTFFSITNHATEWTSLTQSLDSNLWPPPDVPLPVYPDATLSGQADLQATTATWLTDLETMFSQPSNYTFAQPTDHPHNPLGVQRTWNEFMTQMLQS